MVLAGFKPRHDHSDQSSAPDSLHYVAQGLAKPASNTQKSYDASEDVV